MSCRNEDRFRPITVAFRMSYEEHRLIEEKIVISGLKKREYYTKAALKIESGNNRLQMLREIALGNHGRKLNKAKGDRRIPCIFFFPS